MKGRRFVRFVICVALGLAIVLGMQIPTLAVSPGLQATADWRGEYYANADLIGEPVLVRRDAAINFDWGTGVPASGIRADNFSVRWTRSLVFEEGIYRFRAVADDGMRLFVDGVLLIDSWQDGARRELTADRRMTAGQHALRVEYYERGGQAIAQVRWEKVSSTVTGDVRWRGEYWSNVDLNGDASLVRADRAIDFDWGPGAPASGLPADNFSVRWTRRLTFEEGQYRFRAIVDDGVRLFVDGALVIDDWRDGGRRELTAVRRLSAGMHTLRVEYYERSGLAVAQVRWEKIPSTAPDSSGWRGEYYSNPDLRGNPPLVRTDAAIDFGWGNGAPASGLPADNFSVRWTRTLSFEEGTYLFRATADDGIRLYVDGILAIDEWRDGAQREATAERRLTAGTHTLRVEYYEHSGVAVARVRWEKATPTAPDDPAWKGEYWGNLDLSGNPALTRNDSVLAFDWGQGTPGGTLSSDNWSARWTRRVNFDAGTYRFHILVDDGIRLRLNDRLILDAWSDHNSAQLTTDQTLAQGTYTIRVEYYERIGNARIHVWWEKIAAPSYADWKGEYWPNRDLSGEPVLMRNDRGANEGLGIDFDWGAGAPSSDLPADDFSARWTRQAYFEGGTYRFYALSDDGVRLWVDGQRVIDKWRDQGPTESSKEVALTRGTHKLKVEYYEHIGGAQIHVWWKKVAAPSYSDWKGEYWSNRDLSGKSALVRNDKDIDFSWGTGAAAAGLPKDNFSVRWTRQVTFQPGIYRFYAWADDGIRVYMDDRPVVDEWHTADAQVYTVDLSINGARRLAVEYYEQGGEARVRFWWKRIGDI